MRLLFFLLTYVNCFTISIVLAQEQVTDAQDFKESTKEMASDSTFLARQMDKAEALFYSDFDAARTTAQEVLHVIEKKPATAYLDRLRVRAWNTLANCDIEQNNHVQALSYIQAATDLAQALGDSILLGRSFSVRGTLARVRKEYATSEGYYNKAIRIQKRINDTIGLAKTYLNYSVRFNKPGSKRLDSVPYYLSRVKRLDTAFATRINADANLGAYYIHKGKYEKAVAIYKEMVAAHKSENRVVGLPASFMNLGATYAFLKNKEASYQAMDSAIYYAKQLKIKELLMTQYLSRSNINNAFGDYKEAYKNHILHKKYADSVNDITEAKRITALELNYQFEKEKEVAAAQLSSERSKRILYVVLLIIAVLSSMIVFYLIKKNSRHRLTLARNKIALQKVEKLKAELSLAHRENELKKVLVENSITEIALDKALNDVKEIIKLDNEEDRKRGLKSLSASLLSKKSTQEPISGLQEYLDAVEMDFKVHIDANYSDFKPKEKELLYLMKAGLSTTKISELCNTSLPAVKSTRYRVRKKLGLDSKADIIAYLESTMKDV